MPQLILEYSSNILEKDSFEALFKKCHELLVKVLPTELATCKSRAIECDTYYIGDGSPKNAFVYVIIEVMPGRSQETLKPTVAGRLRTLFTKEQGG